VVTIPFAKQMFGSADAAVGQSFQISGIPFTIIGTFKESVDDFGQSEITDNTILIPYSVARYFTGTDNVKQIYFSLRSMDDVPDARRSCALSKRGTSQLGLQDHRSEGSADHGRH
jgi:putative ABC transport system permease protein